MNGTCVLTLSSDLLKWIQHLSPDTKVMFLKNMWDGETKAFIIGNGDRVTTNTVNTHRKLPVLALNREFVIIQCVSKRNADMIIANLWNFFQHVKIQLLGQKSLIIFVYINLKTVETCSQYPILQNLIFILSFRIEVETYTKLAGVTSGRLMNMCTWQKSTAKIYTKQTNELLGFSPQTN